ncbi:MBL fold metallo-hydrolase [Bowmanella dokdonensis]|uniref:MBL fold metallo-hydrolase n=1 Tax=Bowmanella dokdonensis TaxID=751969 RepID=A0A939DM33_9ALTE|nr:MBL fold metallo-hydrolase [Bowmanella dokdonensis]MBN7824291.1 MBL fold metallo-hydrolase [Bowmanella dokdonensis]
MQMRRFETPGIAHYAYLIADGGKAAVFDPGRFVEPYLDAAQELDAHITHVVETHRQEDFTMGSAYLAQLTGAQIVNGPFETFGHGDLRLDDGDCFSLGGLTIRGLHTPGHTPESMSYVVYPPGNERSAWCVLTGDALFYGTTGRTDLPDEDKSVQNAALLYDSVHSKLAGLPDTTLVLPAHGPGSVCGSGMAEKPFSTLGEEKQYNEVFRLSRDEFSRKKGGERLPRPPYFRLMERVNLKGGLSPCQRIDAVPLFEADDFADKSAGSLVIDAREPEGFAGGHIRGSHSIWLGGLPVFGGWVADEKSPVYLITDRTADVRQAARHLARIGIDQIDGALAGGFGTWRKSGLPIEMSGTLTPQTLADNQDRFQVLDVREADEYAEGHIPGAIHMYVGYLADNLHKLQLSKERPLVVTCGVGHRAGLGVSILLRAGFREVLNLLGGMSAWKASGLPVEH